jgi:hypothetical protein
MSAEPLSTSARFAVNAMLFENVQYPANGRHIARNGLPTGTFNANQSADVNIGESGEL